MIFLLRLSGLTIHFPLLFPACGVDRKEPAYQYSPLVNLEISMQRTGVSAIPDSSQFKAFKTLF